MAINNGYKQCESMATKGSYQKIKKQSYDTKT